ncbi:hypothetical protein GGI43DRAFT_208445 [Trichoderma evansii]
MASMPYKESAAAILKKIEITRADLISITSSPPFTFVVGPDQKEHTIHAALVAHQSAALAALINGGMKESIERRVIWKEISEEVFIRFSQFVYTGDYDEVPPSEREVKAVTPCRVAPSRVIYPSRFSGLDVDLHLLRGNPRSRGSKNNGVEEKRPLWDRFLELYPLPPSRPAFTPPSASYDYTDVFLCHTRMYIFADYYGIDPLQILALHKLRLALIPFTLYVENCSDIIQLVRNCFEQTVDKGGQVDRLRSLVCLYTACKVEDLWTNPEFRDLTKTLPDFSEGLITAMLEQLD